MPPKCDVCGKRHKPRCDEDDETTQCLECGGTEDLHDHPDYPGDRLCKDHLIDYYENRKDELEDEIGECLEKIRELRGNAV